MTMENKIKRQIEIPEPEKRIFYDPALTDENGVNIGALNQYMALRSLDNEMKNKLEFIERKKSAMVANDDEDKLLEIVEARVRELKLEDIMNFTKEQVEEVLTVEGDRVLLPIENKNIEDEYRKDFLVYLKESQDYTDKINTAIESINQEMENFNEEYKKITEEYGDMNKYMQDRMRCALESDQTSEEEKDKIRDMLLYTDYGFNLSPIYDEIKTLIDKNGVKSIMYKYTKDLSDEIARAHDILAKLQSSKIEVPFHLYLDIEEKFLPEKYKLFKNLLLFLFARWVVVHRNNLNKLNIIFLVQFVYNLRCYYDKKFDDETMKRFEKHICDLLDLIVDKIPKDQLN